MNKQNAVQLAKELKMQIKKVTTKFLFRKTSIQILIFKSIQYFFIIISVPLKKSEKYAKNYHIKGKRKKQNKNKTGKIHVARLFYFYPLFKRNTHTNKIAEYLN